MNKSLLSSRFLFWALAAMWLQGAIASSLPAGYTQGMSLLALAGVPAFWAKACVVGGIAANACLAVLSIAALHAPSWRKSYWQISALLVSSYTLLGSVLAPQLWLDAFGALAKNLPLLALFCLAIDSSSFESAASGK